MIPSDEEENTNILDPRFKKTIFSTQVRYNLIY